MNHRKLWNAGIVGVAFGIWYCGKSSTEPGTGGGDTKSTPQVESTAPADKAIDIPVGSSLTITFSVPMDMPATQAAITAVPAINGAFTWGVGDTKVSLSPSTDLQLGTKYTVTVGMAAKSKTGVAMAADRIFSFTTGADTGINAGTATQIAGTIFRREDNTTVAGADVVLYNANDNNPLMRTVSDVLGKYRFKADSGNYYLGVTAMGRIPSPAPGGRYTPFRLDTNTIYTRDFRLRKDSSGVPVGGLEGRILVSGLDNLAGVLVVAVAADSSSFSAITGPDGTFRFHNLPVGGGYTLVAYRSGLAGDSLSVQGSVALGEITQGVILKLSVDPGRALNGQVQFLAATNIIADITLVDPRSRLAIPGLRTFNTGTTYRMAGIPPGGYIAWGSYLNDGYVMDPDHIRKFGLPKVTFLPSDTLKTVDFAFTRAIEIVRPTNPPDSLYPVPVNSLEPFFVWKHEASAQEIIIEVFDSKGERIWGGWDSTGTILHKQILANPGGLDSVQFNFDGSAREALKRTDTYSWKIYADGDRAPGIQKLISATEDLRGLFMAGTSRIPVDDT